MFNEDAEVKQVDEDCAGSDEDAWEERGIDFSQISRWESVLLRGSLVSVPGQAEVHLVAYLCNELALLELAVDQSDFAVLVEFCTAQPQLIRRPYDSPQARTVVQESRERWKIVGL